MVLDVRCTTKWNKPSQPLGVPFYGLLDKGWMVAMWSFKDRVGVGFIAGSLLQPEPPITTMAGPWNRGTLYKGRRIDIYTEQELDEELLRSWLKQSLDLPGWGKVELIITRRPWVFLFQSTFKFAQLSQGCTLGF